MRGFPEDEAGEDSDLGLRRGHLQPFCIWGAFGRVWPHPLSTSAPLLRLTTTRAPTIPRGYLTPPRLYLLLGLRVSSLGELSPHRAPSGRGSRLGVPLEWGEAWVAGGLGKDPTSALHGLLWGGPFSTGDPHSCSLEGGWVGGVGGGLEVESLGTEGTVLSSCAEAHPASPTKGDRLLPCLISYLPTNVCSKGHTESRSSTEMKVPLIQACHLSVTPGLQPARLLCPWDSPGKNTGVGCHAFLPGTFPTQDRTWVPHTIRQILYLLSHQSIKELSIKNWFKGGFNQEC